MRISANVFQPDVLHRLHADDLNSITPSYDAYSTQGAGIVNMERITVTGPKSSGSADMSSLHFNSREPSPPPLWTESHASVKTEDGPDAARQVEADWLSTSSEFNKLSEEFKQIVLSSPTATDGFYQVLHGGTIQSSKVPTAYNDGRDIYVPDDVLAGHALSAFAIDSTFHEIGQLVTAHMDSGSYANDPYAYAVARAQGEVNAQYYAVTIEAEIGGQQYGIPRGGFGYSIPASDWQAALLRGLSPELYHSMTEVVLNSGGLTVTASDLNGDGYGTHLDQYLAEWKGVGGMGFSEWVIRP